MSDLDQATLNLQYAQAQRRRIHKLEEENLALHELVEVMRLHLLNMKTKLQEVNTNEGL